MTNKTFGKYGEEIAKNFLIKNGCKILEMNYRYSKLAEIDIIAEKNNILHFVEVKTRSTECFISPLEAINKKKILSIIKCASYYMTNSKHKYDYYQIDAVAIIASKNQDPKIEYIENITV